MVATARVKGYSTSRRVMIFSSSIRTAVWIPLLSILLVIGSGQLHPEEVESRAIISDRLIQVMKKAHPGETFKVWVFFTDKSQEEAKLSRRCQKRRILRGTKPIVDSTDLPLRGEYISQVLNSGAKLRAKSRWLNAISLQASLGEIRQISLLPFVERLDMVNGFKRREVKGEVMPKIKWNGYWLDYGPSYSQLSLLHIPQLHQLGYDGSGVLVCLLDTGFYLAHECFDSLNVVATWDFIFKDGDVQDGPEDRPGQQNHGTSTLSVISGFKDDELIGAAFGASYALAKTEDIRSETRIEEDYWIAGLEWADSLGADVVSSSLGYTRFDDDTGYTYQDLDGDKARTTVAADLAVAKGMVVVTAAGNERDKSWHYIITPADGDSVLAVGAVDMEGNLARFSSVGPTADGRIKPDLVAPGVGVWSAEPRSSYSYKSGTSFSTPLVAGAVALLLQVDSTLTPMEVKERLCSAGSQASSPDTLMGWGIPNILKACGLSPPQLANDLWCYPNPFREVTNIAYILRDGGPVTIQIFTVSGELVRVMDLGLKRPGKYTSPEEAAHWKGENQRGEKVAPGIYLCRLVSGDFSQVIKTAYLGSSTP
jgi:serine protease AprX